MGWEKHWTVYEYKGNRQEIKVEETNDAIETINALIERYAKLTNQNKRVFTIHEFATDDWGRSDSRYYLVFGGKLHEAPTIIKNKKGVGYLDLDYSKLDTMLGEI